MRVKNGANGLMICLLIKLKKESLGTLHGGLLGESKRKNLFQMAEYLRTAIVAIHQLPRTQETLWLRILGRKRVQAQAIDELEALPSNHPFRRATLELLYNLRSYLESKSNSRR